MTVKKRGASRTAECLVLRSETSEWGIKKAVSCVYNLLVLFITSFPWSIRVGRYSFTSTPKLVAQISNLCSNPSEIIWEWKGKLILTYIFSCILSVYSFDFQVWKSLLVNGCLHRNAMHLEFAFCFQTGSRLGIIYGIPALPVFS